MKTNHDIETTARRSFLTKYVGGATLAGLGALGFGRLLGRDAVVARAADGEGLIIGHGNAGTSTTGLTSSPTGTAVPALQVVTNSPEGTGVYGGANATSGFHTTGTVGQSFSPDGVGVFGHAAATDPGTIAGRPTGVVGFTASPSGIGVSGHVATTSGQNIGVEGSSDSLDGIGVRGFVTSASPGTVFGRPIGVAGLSASPTGRGVIGHATAATGQTIGVVGQAASPSGTGVAGFTTATTGFSRGVVGLSNSAEGIGVTASNPAGVALQVNGLSAFSTVGEATIPLGQSAIAVSDGRVTSMSHISVTLTGDPGTVSGSDEGDDSRLKRVAVDWVQRSPRVGFTLHLTRRTSNNTPFTYFIVEPT